jgi:hypothetical protein
LLVIGIRVGGTRRWGLGLDLRPLRTGENQRREKENCEQESANHKRKPGWVHRVKSMASMEAQKRAGQSKCPIKMRV